MNFLIERQPSSERSTKGEMFQDGLFFCYTLERPEAGSIVAIPPGIYDIELFHSPHFNRILPHIINVPGRSAILMHGGNEAKDSLGCILCGYEESGPDWIGDSEAVADLVANIGRTNQDEEIQIQIVEP